MKRLRLTVVAVGIGVLAVAAMAQDAPADNAATSKSVLEYINDGGKISYVLVLLSFVAVALVIRNMIQIRAKVMAPPDVVSRLDALLRDGDMKGALALCTDRNNDSSISRLFGAALARCLKSPFGFLEFRSALEEAGQKEIERLYRYNDGIGIIAAIGPMLGLLGTVFGMIGAFAAISVLEGAARSHQLAGFMSVALIATAEGLLVAIPCTVAFAIFRRRIDSLFGEVADITEDLASRVTQEGSPDRGAGSGRGPRPDPAPAARGRPAGGGVVKFSSPKTVHPKEVVFDLTNFIDVVLLLIIFFMLTAQFAKSEQAEMDLPKEKGDAPAATGAAALVIDLDKSGGLSMLGRATDMTEVTAAVQSALAQPGGSPLGLDLVVRADRACPAAHLNRLAEALAGMGVRTWKLATQNEGG